MAVAGWIVAAALAVLLFNLFVVLGMVLRRNAALTVERDEAWQAETTARRELLDARKRAGDVMAVADAVAEPRPTRVNARYVAQRVVRTASPAVIPDDQPVLSDLDWQRFDDWFRQQRYGR